MIERDDREANDRLQQQGKTIGQYRWQGLLQRNDIKVAIK